MKNIKKILTIALSTTLMSVNVVALPLATYAETEIKNYNIDKASLYWDITDSKVMVGWDETEDKTSYRVKLFKGSKGISSFITTNKPTYDFTNYILEKGTGTYRFYVYAARQGRERQIASETQTIDSEQLTELRKNNRNRTSTSTNNTTTNGQRTGASTSTPNAGPGANLPGSSNSSTSNNVGSYNKGWNKIDNTWYWLNDDNTLANNTWKEVNGKWYYFDTNSAMITRWKEINGLWYYFDNANGDMLVDTTTPDNYRVNTDGVWIK